MMKTDGDGDASCNVLPESSGDKPGNQEQLNVCKISSGNELKTENEEDIVHTGTLREKPEVPEISVPESDTTPMVSNLCPQTKMVEVDKDATVTSSESSDIQNLKITSDKLPSIHSDSVQGHDVLDVPDSKILSDEVSPAPEEEIVDILDSKLLANEVPPACPALEQEVVGVTDSKILPASKQEVVDVPDSKPLTHEVPPAPIQEVVGLTDSGVPPAPEQEVVDVPDLKATDEITPAKSESTSKCKDGHDEEAEDVDDGDIRKSSTEDSGLVAKCKDGGDEDDHVDEGDDILKSPKSRDCILKPLLLATEKATDMNKEGFLSALIDVRNSEFAANQTPCMLCDNIYENVDKKEEHDEYLCHLIVEHDLVIADVKLIADLRTYALYWKRRFAEKPLKEFCALIRTNTGTKDLHASEEYHLLCDALLEDRRVREKLQLIRLKELIDRQSDERNCADFDRMCLFCTKFFIGDRDELFTHMNEDHNFNVGHPQNLIYVDEFLDAIEEKLNRLECLFCDRVFKDRASLREHMRKKSHRRLNPKNKLYDKYYIINYLELGKNWEVLQNEPDHLDGADDWSGWDEDPQNAVCFFCNASFGVQDEVYVHMKDDHDFDFPEMRKSMSLSFYQQVKMINYIRREVHRAREAEKPAKEGEEKESENAELAKLTANDFAKDIKESILNTTKWNQPQYYFPTYENDTLLCQVEDKEGLFEPEDTFIIGEDGIDCKAIINDSVLTDLVITGYFD